MNNKNTYNRNVSRRQAEVYGMFSGGVHQNSLHDRVYRIVQVSELPYTPLCRHEDRSKRVPTSKQSLEAYWLEVPKI